MMRWTRFAGVGLMGFSVQLVTLHLLMMVTGIPYPLAVLIAVEAAILHNFAWHEGWTWRDRRHLLRTTRTVRWLRFNAASGAVSLAGNALLTIVLVEAFGVPVLPANVAAIAALTAINYLLADRFAFAAVEAPVRSSSAGALRARRVAQRRGTAAAACALALIVTGAPAQASEPTAATLRAWEQYVARVEARRARERVDEARFLAAEFDTPPGELERRVRGGEVIIADIAGGPEAAGDGTISHWRGLSFVPGVTLDEMLDTAAVRGPRVKFPREDVLAHRVIARRGNIVDLYLKLQRKAIVTAAYNTEHRITVERLDAARGESRSIATRIAELRDPGTPQERERPEGADRGFLWRLNSYWRYRAVDGGVIVELESLTLSRNVPWAVRAIASPVISRIARESMARSLAALRL